MEMSHLELEGNKQEALTVNIEKYNSIMQKYRNGEFGNGNLTLKEILCAANEPNLLDKMSIIEVQYLIDHNTGFTKMMLLELKNKKFSDDDKSDSFGCTFTKKTK